MKAPIEFKGPGDPAVLLEGQWERDGNQGCCAVPKVKTWDFLWETVRRKIQVWETTGFLPCRCMVDLAVKVNPGQI